MAAICKASCDFLSGVFRCAKRKTEPVELIAVSRNDTLNGTSSISQVADPLQNSVVYPQAEYRASSHKPPSRIHSPSDVHYTFQQKEKAVNALSEENGKLKTTVAKQKTEIKLLKEEIQQAKQEKEELLTRLSKFTSDRLTDENPNIADLGDPNRPTKLAEQFSELYDNEWTEAFERFHETKSDEQAIQELLEIVKKIFQLCKTEAGDQLHKTVQSICSLTNLDEDYDPVKRSVKEFKEMRKQNYQTFLQDLLRRTRCDNILLSNATCDKSIYSYTEKAVKICWLMCIQDPPMELCFDAKKGKKFDIKSFRPYTATGEKVSFLVWPVVLLHEDGPMLTKGIAQGRPRRKKKAKYQKSQINPHADQAVRNENNTSPNVMGLQGIDSDKRNKEIDDSKSMTVPKDKNIPVKETKEKISGRHTITMADTVCNTTTQSGFTPADISNPSISPDSCGRHSYTI